MRTSRTIAAAVAALALAATACGTDDPITESSSEPGLEAVGEGDGGGAAGTCLAGAEDCQDTGGDMGAPPVSAMCAEDTPDCEDMIVASDGLPPEDGDGAEAEPHHVEPSDGLVDVHAVAWQDVSIDEDDQAITVTWWSGVEPCHVLDDVTVEFAQDTVTVTVLEGRTPDDVACIEIAELRAYRVQLDEPIGDRTVVDGAV